MGGIIMEIKVERSRAFWGGTYHQLYKLAVTVDHGYVVEELAREEAENLVVGLVEDILLDDCWKSEVIGKLIEAGIITHEQILEYVEESGEE